MICPLASYINSVLWLKYTQPGWKGSKILWRRETSTCILLWIISFSILISISCVYSILLSFLSAVMVWCQTVVNIEMWCVLHCHSLSLFQSPGRMWLRRLWRCYQGSQLRAFIGLYCTSDKKVFPIFWGGGGGNYMPDNIGYVDVQ